MFLRYLILLDAAITYAFLLSQTMRGAIIEVERKFLHLPRSAALLRANTGTPSFHHFRYLGIDSFTDSYFDRGNSLRDCGIWLRKRNDQWQAKIRVSGDYQNSGFREVQGSTQVLEILREHGISSTAELPNFGLSPFAKFTSQRNKWQADQKFSIVLDETDFGHAVGEVELESVLNERETALQRQDMVKQMDEEIEEFMKKYNWAFPPGKAVGKLSAYFQFLDGRSVD